jgi:hypothetical protein
MVFLDIVAFSIYCFSRQSIVKNKTNTEEGLKRSSLQPHPRHHCQWKASIETNHKVSYSFMIYGQLFFCIYVLVLLIILYFCIAPC